MQFNSSKLRNLLRAIRDIVWWLWDSFIDCICPVQSQRDGTLFVKLDAIGDFVLFYEFLVQYKAAHDKKPLYIACSHETSGLVQATNLFTKVIPVKRQNFVRNPLYRALIFYKLHKLGARRAVQVRFNRDFILGDAVTLRSGAAETIAHSGSLSLYGWRRKWADRSYSSLLSRDEESRHEFEHNRDLMRFLGLSNAQAKVSRLPVLREEIPDRMKFFDPYFVIVPGASNARRKWPVGRFAQLGASLVEKHGWRMLICGSTAEYELGQELLSASGCDGINLCGQTALPEFCELVRDARLLIGNDSGSVHIAAAVGTLSFCLLGGGHFNRFLPYPKSVAGLHPIVIYEEMKCYFCDWVCTHQQVDVSKPFPCIRDITLGHALGVIESRLPIE